MDFNVLDKLFEHGIRVMVDVPIDFDETKMEKRIAEVVNKLKDHPSTLMWSLGNEWNLNTFHSHGFLSVDDCVRLIKKASSIIKKYQMGTRRYQQAIDPWRIWH